MTSSQPLHAAVSRPSASIWKFYLPLLALTSIVVLQNTKQAMLPAKQTPVLWAAELVVLVGVLFLRSGWGRDRHWRESQAEIGTLANNFYEPRREIFSNGFAIAGGVFGALLWALATWSVVFRGMQRNVAARGLADFEVAALAGAIAGGIIGAMLGLIAGHVWETLHRRRRLERRAHA
jgi:hypothetical protein